MRLNRKMQSIQENRVYQEMMAWYEDLITQFDATPPDLEKNDYKVYCQLDRTQQTALHALNAVIDVHIQQERFIAMQEVRRNSVPVDALAGLLDGAENEKEDGLYQALHRFRDAWNALPGEGHGHTTEQAQSLDAACAQAERGVLEAVQSYARQRIAALQVTVYDGLPPE